MLNSPVDIAIVAGVILLLFGPKKFPEIGKALGQGIGNFKKSLNDAQEEVRSAVKTEATLTPTESAEQGRPPIQPAASPDYPNQQKPR